jgi:hypothetical protein
MSVAIRIAGVFGALYLSGCVTHATIHAKHVTVTVSPSVTAQGLPLPL